jgi:hypothetical protein
MGISIGGAIGIFVDGGNGRTEGGNRGGGGAIHTPNKWCPFILEGNSMR